MALIFFIFVFVFTSNFAEWFFTEGGPPPLYYYLAFLAFGISVVIVRTSQGLPFMTAQSWCQTRPLWMWLFAWAFWIPFAFLYSSNSEVATQNLITRLEMAMILGMFLYLVTAFPHYRILGLVLIGVTILGSVLNIIDFVTPTFSKVPGRSAGMYINPTISGFILNLTATVAIIFVPKPLRWLFLGIASVGIFLTFARAAWILLFVTIIVLFWKGYLGFQKMRAALGLIAVVVVAFLGYSIMSGLLVEILLATSIADYLDANTLARLGMAEFATDTSASEREDVVNLSLDLFSQNSNPFLGYGLGYTSEWSYRVSTHNMYLLYLVEGGLVGFFLYTTLVVIVFTRTSGIGRIAAFDILVYSFFSHNILDSPGRIFFLAFLASGTLGVLSQRSLQTPTGYANV